MTIKTFLNYHNPDSTQDLNNKTGFAIRRSVFVSPGKSGKVTPSVGSLNVEIAPFVAQSGDGLMVVSDALTNLNIPNGPQAGSYYLCMFAKYVIPGPSLVQGPYFKPVSAVDGSVDEPFYIKFARVDITAGSGNLSVADGNSRITWLYGHGDHTNLLGYSSWRDPVVNVADLPSATSLGQAPNKDGDVRLVTSTGQLFYWKEATLSWTQVAGSGGGGGGGDFSILDEQDKRFEDYLRQTHDGTGIISTGPNERQFLDSFPSGSIDRAGPGIINAATLNQVIIEPFQASVAGIPVTCKATTLDLGATPGTGYRYDLIYLEVWKEVFSFDPANPPKYPSNIATIVPGTFVDLTFDQVSTLLMSVDKHTSDESFTQNPLPLSGNFDFYRVERLAGSHFAILKFKYAIHTLNPGTVDFHDGVFSTSYTPHPVTIPGVSGVYLESALNKRIGIATGLASPIYKGVAYAMPMFVVRRDSTEAPFTINTVVDISTNTLTSCNVFPVYPFSDVAVTRKLKSLALPSEQAHAPRDYAGFRGSLLPFELPELANTIGIPNQKAHLNTADYSLDVEFTSQGSTLAVLPNPPTNGFARSIISLVYFTSKENLAITGTAYNVKQMVVGVEYDTHRGAVPVYLYAMYLTADAGNALDDYSAFNGQASFAIFGSTYSAFNPEEPGLWSATFANTDIKIALGLDRLYFIPVALVHRRNSNIYNAVTNPNGSGSTRPEALFGYPNLATNIMPRELLDLRRQIDANLPVALESSLQALMRGDLSTRLQPHPHLGNTVLGTKHLHVDRIGGLVPTTPGDITQSVVPNTLIDGIRHNFSDAPELQVLTWTAIPTAAVYGPDGIKAADPIHSLVFYSASNLPGYEDIPYPPASGTTAKYGVRDYTQNIDFSTVDGSGNPVPVYAVDFNRYSTPVPSDSGKISVTINAPVGSYIHSGYDIAQGYDTVTSITPSIQGIYNLGLSNFSLISTDSTTIPSATTPAIRSTSFRGGAVGGSGIVHDTRASYHATRHLTNDVGVHVSATAVTKIQILATDAVGRPTSAQIEFSVAITTPSPPGAFLGSMSGIDPTNPHMPYAIQVSCAFVYDKQASANKYTNDAVRYPQSTALSASPNKVFSAQGVVRNGSLGKINIGPIYKTIVATSDSSGRFVINATDIAGAGITNPILYGILGVPRLFDTFGNEKPCNVNRISGIHDPVLLGSTSALTVNVPTAALGWKMIVNVAYTCDEVRYWIYINKASRGVIGPFTYIAEKVNFIASTMLNPVTQRASRVNTLAPVHPMPKDLAFLGGVSGPSSNIFNAGATGVAALYTADSTRFASADYVATGLTPTFTNMGRYDAAQQIYHGGLVGYTDMHYDQEGFYYGNSLTGVTLESAVPDATNNSTFMVYQTPIPLYGSDYIDISYEASAYQGAMGQSGPDPFAKLASDVLPDGDHSIKYECVSDIFATTAGSGLSYCDYKDFASYLYYYTAYAISSSLRPVWYDPFLSLNHGVNPAYKHMALSQAQFNKDPINFTIGSNSFVGETSMVSALKAASRSSLLNLMHHIPGPLEFGQLANASLGIGAGGTWDYGHGSLTGFHAMGQNLDAGSLLGIGTFPLISLASSQAQDQVTLVRIPRTNGEVSAVRIVNQGEPTLLSPDDSYTSETGESSYRKEASFGTAKDTIEGYIIPASSDAEIAVGAFKSLSQARSFTLSTSYVAHNSNIRRGVATTRYYVSSQIFSNVFGSGELACENLMTTPIDVMTNKAGNYFLNIPKAQQFEVLLSQASRPVSYNAQGNFWFSNCNVYQAQYGLSAYTPSTVVKVNAFPPGTSDITMSILNVWAFKGSVINREGDCKLLVNAGYGSAVFQNAHLRDPYFGVFPHTGFSADSFELIGRPLKHMLKREKG
jgi:hypothetical protein